MPTIVVDKLLPTITWTLLHSLWQGLILTVLAGMVLLLTRRSTAALRYWTLCTLFFLFIGGVCLTFSLEWNGAMEPTQKFMTAGQASSYFIFSSDHWRTTAAFLNQNAHWIALAWMLILLLKSGQMVREMAYIRALRNGRTWAAEPFWKDKVAMLAAELGIRKAVLLVESAAVKVPIVIGHLKPLVMVPIGMFNHLTPGEMEAVLLHELAHIRRHDYLVNYLQRITETVLFFNPGMLWVSSLLRAEREACCDELAITRTGNKRQFVEALIRCKEHATQTPAFSLALFGNRNVLLQRLNRIVSDRNKLLSPAEGTFFGISILVLTIVLFGWNRETLSSTTVAPASIAVNSGPMRAVVEQISAQQTQREMGQVKTSGNPATKVSPGSRSTQLKKKETKTVASENINIDQQITDPNKDPLQQIVVQLNDRLTTQHRAQKEEAEKQNVQVDLDRVQAEKARHQAETDRAQAELHRQQAARDREQAAHYRELAQQDRLRAEKDRIEVQKIREQANRRWQPETIQ